VDDEIADLNDQKTTQTFQKLYSIFFNVACATLKKIWRVAQKVSIDQESSLNRIKTVSKDRFFIEVEYKIRTGAF